MNGSQKGLQQEQAAKSKRKRKVGVRSGAQSSNTGSNRAIDSPEHHQPAWWLSRQSRSRHCLAAGPPGTAYPAVPFPFLPKTKEGESVACTPIRPLPASPPPQIKGGLKSPDSSPAPPSPQQYRPDHQGRPTDRLTPNLGLSPSQAPFPASLTWQRLDRVQISAGRRAQVGE